MTTIILGSITLFIFTVLGIFIWGLLSGEEEAKNGGYDD